MGGKYLILPPGYDGDVPEGYHVYRSRTYGVWFLVRGFLVDGDPGPAVENFKQGLRIYPLAKADNPPTMEFINVSGKYHNTIHSNNFGFFEEINALIQEEHDDAISRETRGQLALLGIIKGQPFEPDQRLREILNEAALIGAAISRSVSFRSRDEVAGHRGDPVADRLGHDPLGQPARLDSQVHARRQRDARLACVKPRGTLVISNDVDMPDECSIGFH